jgi:ADP-ribosylglycohydrolase
MDTLDIYLSCSETLLIELEQSADEGRDVADFYDEAFLLFEMYKKGKPSEEDAKKLLDRIRSAGIDKDYPYHEPYDLNQIRKLRPKMRTQTVPFNLSRDEYYDKVYGAWLGRCAGCLLGKPVECWLSDRITGLLKDTGNYPITHYISSDIDASLKEKYQVEDKPGIAWINKVDCGPEDDDTNYTIQYMDLLDKKGPDFTSFDVVESWLTNIPILHVATAEKVAYRNFVNRIYPPLSGSYYNAYREWIGAQIRGDFFGYVNPGNCERAAEFAWRDAQISHIKNGIYGEMFVSAMLARAAVSGDINEIIESGLGEIPETSRLYEKIKMVTGWYKQKINCQEAITKFHAAYDEYNKHQAVHVISNAVLCVIALLWGGGDFEKSIGIAVSAGFDTDCNGATVGSIAGMITGASRMPHKWTDPLKDTILSGIQGYGVNKISSLAGKTLDLVVK